MKNKRSTTSEAWAKRLERFPPILVRLLARDPRGQPLSTLQIAMRSGLPCPMVEALSQSTSWDGVLLTDYRSFCSACGMDLLNSRQIKRQESYLNGKIDDGVRHPPMFLFLKLSPSWEIYHKPLMARYIESLRAKVTPNNP